ncbi:MAG TPA: class I SAM-dependent methyltransferase [Asanoa sp.]|nr:class I SAM-dependent methyltransferase [Asanoa sp.]
MKLLLAESGIDTQHPWTGLDVGGRLINTSTRHLLPNTRWTGLDIKPGPDVDIVHDASTWTPDRAYDVVLSTELFEHTPVWREIISTCAAALRPGGYLFITCASTGREPHGAEGTFVVPADEHYGNVDPVELETVMRRHFPDVHVAYQMPPGDAYGRARTA